MMFPPGVYDPVWDTCPDEGSDRFAFYLVHYPFFDCIIPGFYIRTIVLYFQLLKFNILRRGLYTRSRTGFALQFHFCDGHLLSV